MITWKLNAPMVSTVHNVKELREKKIAKCYFTHLTGGESISAIEILLLLKHTSRHQVSRLALNRFKSLTDIQVRHGKIPTSVLQGPFLPSITKFVC